MIVLHKWSFESQYWSSFPDQIPKTKQIPVGYVLIAQSSMEIALFEILLGTTSVAHIMAHANSSSTIFAEQSQLISATSAQA